MDNLGELSPLEYQKAAVKIQQARVEVQPHLNIPEAETTVNEPPKISMEPRDFVMQQVMGVRSSIGVTSDMKLGTISQSPTREIHSQAPTSSKVTEVAGNMATNVLATVGM